MSEWQKHDGSGLPVSVGTMVIVKRMNGEISQPFAAGTKTAGKALNPLHSNWHWTDRGIKTPDFPTFIVAYRILNDGEEAKREARLELFKKMIEGVAPVGGEPKLPAPKKKVKVSG